MKLPFSRAFGNLAFSQDTAALEPADTTSTKSTKKKVAKKKTPAKKAAKTVVEAGSRTFRPDSKRGQVIVMASKDGGTTFRKLMNATQWELPELKAALGRIKSYSGLTVVTDGEGESTKVSITGTLRTRKAFDFKPKKQLKAHKADTKRSLVLGMLLSKDGATMDEIKKVTKWDARTAYEGVRLVHSYLGYGLREDDDGKIHAYQGDAKDAEVAAPKAPKPAKKAAAKKAPKAKAKKAPSKKAGGKKKAAGGEAPAATGEASAAAEGSSEAAPVSGE